MNLVVRDLGNTQYGAVFDEMRAFTDARQQDTPDELWITEHASVFTQGQNGKTEHLLAPGDIPVVQSDRGGQVTYHAPGQLVGYLMFDIRRMEISPRDLVAGIEHALIAVLARYDIVAMLRSDAPGVYVDGAKIGSLGLRIRRGRSYHGLALNVAMDLTPFSLINPCGIEGIGVTQMSDLGGSSDLEQVKKILVDELLASYGFENRIV
jgi:lipoyl(octanoyl) transferase